MLVHGDLSVPYLLLCFGIVGLHAGDHGCDCGQEFSDELSLSSSFGFFVVLYSDFVDIRLQLLSVFLALHVVVRLYSGLQLLRVGV